MPTYTYTTLDDPSAVGGTSANGINDAAQIAGYSGHGFLYNPNGGTYTRLDDPQGFASSAGGINASGQIVGFYASNNGNHGFLYSGGTYTTLDAPQSVGSTTASGINNAGQIVGWNTEGVRFLYSAGSYTTMKVPGALPLRPVSTMRGRSLGLTRTATGPHTASSTAVVPTPPSMIPSPAWL